MVHPRDEVVSDLLWRVAPLSQVGDAANQIEAVRRPASDILNEAHEVSLVGSGVADERRNIGLPQAQVGFEATLSTRQVELVGRSRAAADRDELFEADL